MKITLCSCCRWYVLELSMKILAIDHGTKRIGLAVSDELGITARSLPIINVKNKKQAIDKIAEVVEAQNCQKILIGIPSGYKNIDSAQAMIVKNFTEKLRTKIPPEIEITTWDESYSSKEASQNLKGSAKNRLDSEAAKIILLEYLNS